MLSPASPDIHNAVSDSERHRVELSHRSLASALPAPQPPPPICGRHPAYKKGCRELSFPAAAGQSGEIPAAGQYPRILIMER